MASKKPIDLTERLTRTVAKVSDQVVSDPVLPTRMTVTLEQLRAYDRNPRRTANPMYADLKDSIRNRGLQQPPRITRRPGAEHYMIMDGGNTRLQILEELWAETQDPQFFSIDCMFHPWVSEEHVLSGHLIENDMRGDIKLIERATGAKQWIAMLELETGESISQSEAARRMTAAGWKIDQSNLSVLMYAVNHLVEHLPLLLWGGAGTPLVKEIRRCEKAYRDYWDSLVANGEQPSVEFEKVWAETLQEFDDEERFAMEDWRRTLDIRISDVMDESWTAVGAEVEAILRGAKPSGVKSENRVYGKNAETVAAGETVELESGAALDPGASESGKNTREPAEPVSKPRETGAVVRALPTKKVAPNLRDYQIEAWTAVNAILERLSLEQFLVPTFDWTHHEGPTGIGFILNPVPLDRLGPGGPIRYYTYLQSIFLGIVSSIRLDEAKQYLYTVIDMALMGANKSSDEQLQAINSILREVVSLNYQRTTPLLKTNKRHGESLFMTYVSQLEAAIQGMRVLTDNKLEELFVIKH
jgi:ParB family protein of integrating conjugative element (PFGI_1 class)